MSVIRKTHPAQSEFYNRTNLKGKKNIKHLFIKPNFILSVMSHAIQVPKLNSIVLKKIFVFRFSRRFRQYTVRILVWRIIANLFQQFTNNICTDYL